MILLNVKNIHIPARVRGSKASIILIKTAKSIFIPNSQNNLLVKTQKPHFSKTIKSNFT